MRVGKDLNFDVPWRHQRALQQQARFAEGALRFGLGRVECGVELLGLHDQAHAAAPAAGRGLDHQRPADRASFTAQCLAGLVLTVVAGKHGNARGGHALACARLVAHGAHRIWRRADPHEPGVDHRLRKGGVLGQEAVAGMHGLRGAGARGREQLVDAQVRIGRPLTADRHRLIAARAVRRMTVGVGGDRDGAQPHSTRGAGDARDDLAAVGNQQRVESAHVGGPSGVSVGATTQLAARLADKAVRPSSAVPLRKAAAKRVAARSSVSGSDRVRRA